MSRLIIFLLVAGMLAACGQPGSTTLPTATAPAVSQPLPTASIQTQPAPTGPIRVDLTERAVDDVQRITIKDSAPQRAPLLYKVLSRTVVGPAT